MFPTKALAQDQCEAINAMLALMPGEQGRAYVYDGDTPKSQRAMIRAKARIIVTNPDMLHAAILPHHHLWSRFLGRLQVVVMDEMHVYRGVFGTHVALVMRRLKRVCHALEAHPTFITCSATIANPSELAHVLTGQRSMLVHNSGAPQPARTVCLLNPFAHECSERASALSISTTWAADALSRGLGTIVFARSRRAVESTASALRSKLSDSLADRVEGYRGGYMPAQRRATERRLKSGQLRGVVSTNALELGVDIGGLDVCIQAGYPGTIASTWQQLGRAGRRGGEALGVMVASRRPLDQFIANHPEHLFEAPAEHARVDISNLKIWASHASCAAHEHPISEDESLGNFDLPTTQAILSHLASTNASVLRDGRVWRGRPEAAFDTNLRGLSGRTVSIIQMGEERVLGTLGAGSALVELFEGALYTIAGQRYEVQHVDAQAAVAWVVKTQKRARTRALLRQVVHVEHVHEVGQRFGATVSLSDVGVHRHVLGYEIAQRGASTQRVEIDGARDALHTSSYRLTIDARRFAPWSLDEEAWSSMCAGLAHAVHTASCVVVMCDATDLGQHVDVSQTHVRVDLYDKHDGGAGLASGLYTHHPAVMQRALDVVSHCPCQQGCPACVGVSKHARRACEHPLKINVERVLTTLARAAPRAARAS